MRDLAELPGLRDLWSDTSGDAGVLVAILDGLVDLSHPCFAQARVEPQDARATPAGNAISAAHGTHVASILFGQPGSPVAGVAPGCRGLSVPVFGVDASRISQLDLARGIEYAIDAGAHVINISGGQLVDDDTEAEAWLRRAVQACTERNILVIAAAGNDGCTCLHAPALLSGVLAVGAIDRQGRPLPSSNWGDGYRSQGVLAPGEGILGALPGGGTARGTGTSFATPIVSGVAALLLSLQRQQGRAPDPLRVREILLQTAIPCEALAAVDCGRYLAGVLNVPGAHRAMSDLLSCGCQGAQSQAISPSSAADLAAAAGSSSLASPAPAVAPSGVVQSASDARLVYALGALGYDFGTEARRDSFRQLMPPVAAEGGAVPPNPYDPRQMVAYLEANPSEARSLIWTLNLELTPVYAIEAHGAFGRDVYEQLRQALAGQTLGQHDAAYVEHASVPGVLTGQTVRLFSGQVVPVIEVHAVRGLYAWKVNALLDAATEAVRALGGELDEARTRRALREFLTRIYYDLRNLGVIASDRALNFAATNAFQAAATFADAVAERMQLDTIDVGRSPVCRPDSDCWDVKLKFFDPDNVQRAKRIYRFTIDVSDLVPVTLGDVRSWSAAD